MGIGSENPKVRKHSPGTKESYSGLWQLSKRNNSMAGRVLALHEANLGSVRKGGLHRIKIDIVVPNATRSDP